MSRISAILSIGDRVRLVKLGHFIDTPEVPVSEATERLEGGTGIVTSIVIPGNGINEQPRYVNVRMDSGEGVEAISLYHIHRIIRSIEDSFQDVKDEDLWFHLTCATDFGG